MNSIYCKKQNENGNTYLLKMIKMTDHLAFLVLEEAGAYLGKATENYLLETAAYFSMNKEAYISEIEKHVKVTLPDVKINISDDRLSINKKMGKLNITYFSIDMEQVNFGKMAMNIATELLNLYEGANQNVVETNDKLLQIQSSRDIYKDKLERYTMDHNNSESQLHSSFLLILNEKKRQLQFYKDLLAKAQLANQVSKSPTHVILSSEENSEELCNIDETNNNGEDNYNTDDEKEAVISNSIINSFDSEGEPLPGPSKRKHSSPSAGRKNWKPTKSADFNKQPAKSANKLNLRSHSDSNLNVKNVNDFDINMENFDNEFDLSDTEITPPPKLSKRIKPASNISTVIKNSSQLPQVIKAHVKQAPPEVVDDSPTLNFNTQDLFDRI